ncbi:MAG: 50S ribosomal protein L11 methyltransferase [candidate division Zixibacteria bacterium]|nr:50S ribosomal protein L11 methyltransferase [candidate division Zixibacteria bacterium]
MVLPKPHDKDESRLTELRVELPPCHVDAVCDFIISEEISNGLVLEDEEDCDVTTVIFYVNPDETDQQRAQLASYVNGLVGDNMPIAPEITSRTIVHRMWEEEYRKSVLPVIVADDITIVPPWITDVPQTRYQIIIEPRMAFGSGTHETTRSCMIVLRKYFKPDARFLDMGCGSGILSILADKMGASYIKAIDYDVVAIENCRENVIANRITAPNNILFGSIEKCRGDEPYDFVCANIIKVTVLEMLDDLVSLTSSPGMLVLSGLLEQDVNEVSSALKAHDFSEVDIYPDNEWRTIIVQKEC